MLTLARKTFECGRAFAEISSCLVHVHEISRGNKPAKTVMSPCSSLLTMFWEDEINQCLHNKSGIVDLSTPKNQKPGDLGENLEIYQWREKKTTVKQGVVNTQKQKSLRIHFAGYKPSHSALNFVFT